MAFLVAMACMAAAQEPTDWPTYHGGYSLDGVAGAAPPDAPARLWRYQAEGRVEATPVAAGGRIFFTTSKGAVVALDLRGRESWKVKLEKETFSAPPLCVGKSVIVGSDTGVLYALDAETGRQRWTATVGDKIQGTANRLELPGGKVGIVAISQSDGSLHCVDFETGAAVWKTEPQERCDGSAGVGGGRIVMGSCASALHVFSAEKGEKSGDVELGGDNQVAGGVAISGKTAFAGTRSGKLVAVDLAERKLLWTNTDNQSEAFATPAVSDRYVVFGSDDGRVYALRREKGEKAWDFDTGWKATSPVIAGNRVVVSSRGSLFLLDLEKGAKLWSAEVSDEITSPAVVGGRIIVGANDGTVTAYGRE